ncbi:TetR/AcrR family transcriptional regulator [Streptomyces sp. NPDC001714]|uniref:TetR/AcrR family transcriptional regulator n=1 Tax=Streptomyces sp. NPDC001714 TaxID=3364603 RepID=UPI00368DBF15
MVGSSATPNQAAKQQQIIEAARAVLARDGLAGCTVRAVAEAGPLTKSAVHYYFADMDELVELAMAEHIRAFVRGLRQVAEGGDGFWGAVEAYLRTFRERQGIALLWFDYWLDAVRKGREEAVERMHGEVVAVFAELLGRLDAEDRAEALFSYLLGEVVQQAVRAKPFTETTQEIARLCGVKPPYGNAAG